MLNIDIEYLIEDEYLNTDTRDCEGTPEWREKTANLLAKKIAQCGATEEMIYDEVVKWLKSHDKGIIDLAER